MKGFMSQMSEVLNEDKNISVTENGALGYKTTGEALLDLNFSVSSLRGCDENEIGRKFIKAYLETPDLALKWMFYCRDIRGGLGERKIFRSIIKYMGQFEPYYIIHLVRMIPFYGRWDDMFSLIGTNLEDEALYYIWIQFNEDLVNMREGKSISLLAKWMPSINTSSGKSRALARKIMEDFIQRGMHFNDKIYRKSIAQMREYINVVERKMSDNNFDKIDYRTVPSKANLLYANSFLKHDLERRTEFLESLNNGEEKINAKILYPHELFIRALHVDDDENAIMLLNNMWKQFPDLVGGQKTIVVCDGSGSMEYKHVQGSKRIYPIHVARALALYFAEKLTGDFKNKFITFSSRPELIDLSDHEGLVERARYICKFDDCSNTNIEAVFGLILRTAVNSELDPKDMPDNILITSDMEFDAISTGDPYSEKRLFETISKRFEDEGYKLPRIIFWNLGSRSGTIPMVENENGVLLVSGFSINICNMVLSNERDPMKALVETLNSERYADILTFNDYMHNKFPDMQSDVDMRKVFAYNADFSIGQNSIN